MKRKARGIVSLILMLTMIITMLMPASAANAAEAQAQASALKQLGLFKGVSATDFDLDRAPSRTEAIVMLIRVLGKEAEVLSSNASHPFTDVPSWADQYVAYAYEKGLANGVSATKFGTGNADSDMYLTFVLRALDYDDSKGDFAWNAPDILAGAVGILPSGVDTAHFLRADVVLVSWAALEADLKGGSQTLSKKLISAGTFTADDYTAAQKLANVKTLKSVLVSSVAALKTALADTSNKVVTIDSIGSPVVVTGQLTIPAGVTLTVNRGNDFYIEGTLINNGTIEVMGANAIDKAADFINYSVMSVKEGGKVVNNGAIKLIAATLEDTADNGPVGGQLRVLGGTFDNKGSVYLKVGAVNTHGGMVVVEGGTFNNDATVVVDGFFLRVGDGGAFNNHTGAVVINNTAIFTEGTGVFTNKGTLTGNEINP